MNKKGAALIALAGFGLGVFVGKGFAALDSRPTGDAIAPAVGDGHVAGRSPAHRRTQPRRRGDDDAADEQHLQWQRGHARRVVTRGLA